MLKRGVWLPVLLIAAVAAAIALVVTRPWDTRGTEDAIGQQLRDELSARVVTVLEQDREGRELVTIGAEPVGCAARALGTDPRGAASVEQVRTVYAWAICWTVVDGKPLTGASAPVAVHFGAPVRVDHASNGGGYTESVKAMFPSRLHDVAFDNNRWAADLAGRAEARARQLAGG